MGWTMGCRDLGRVSTFRARVLAVMSIHCQSQLDSVGKPASAGCLVSFQKPSMVVPLGFIRWFQKMGRVDIMGSEESRSAPLGRKRTFPPEARRVWASGQEDVMRMDAGTVALTLTG